MPCPAYITQALICFNIKRLHRYPRPAQAQRRRARTAGAEPLLCRAAAMPCPAYITQASIHSTIKRLHRYPRPRKRSAAGQEQPTRSRFMPGGGNALPAYITQALI
ncbi:hypothetical protein EZJ07_04095 [Klebsiella pneumoniae]|nr:hypothetical protein EZJ07_04095 [Klebsiella pneumoniae]